MLAWRRRHGPPSSRVRRGGHSTRRAPRHPSTPSGPPSRAQRARRLRARLPARSLLHPLRYPTECIRACSQSARGRALSGSGVPRMRAARRPSSHCRCPRWDDIQRGHWLLASALSRQQPIAGARSRLMSRRAARRGASPGCRRIAKCEAQGKPSWRPLPHAWRPLPHAWRPLLHAWRPLLHASISPRGRCRRKRSTYETFYE